MASFSKNKRIVLVSGNFNIVHPGHLRLLDFARNCGDVLVVCLFRNNEDTFVDFDDRKASLEALDGVDQIVESDKKKLFEVIEKVKPDIVVKGKEHEFTHNIETEVLSSYGGKLIFGSGEIQYSSRDLLRKELIETSVFQLKGTKRYQSEHSIETSSLIERVEKFSKIRVLVLGEVILDEYVQCDPLGMSQEDPTIVVTPVDTQYYLGGAGIVAAHLAGLGAEASLLSVVGNDASAERVADAVKSYGVRGLLVKDESRPTIRKQRFRASGKTMLRVSHLRSHDVSRENINEMLHYLVRAIDNVDVVIFSDFNYGCLPQTFVDKVIDVCLRRKLPFLADSQASSQVGDVSRFKDSLCLCATEREARLALNDFKSGLQSVIERLSETSRAKNLIVKLGAEGLIAMSKNQYRKTDSLRALNSNPSDVAGAGDALLATTSLSFACGGNIWDSALLGSIAAGIQVSRVGNKPLSKKDLAQKLGEIKNQR